jgi:predicted 3-demethylubiquinone-9 3-methyltransferase (glyoxalase superfamily)
MIMKHAIYPCLWYDQDAGEAAKLYCSLFDDSKILHATPMVVRSELAGYLLMGLNGGPLFRPNPSISFFVICDTKDELQKAWDGLADGGKVMMPLNAYPWSDYYGWVQDRYGVTWQLSYGKNEEGLQKISPVLMFTRQQAGKAEEAIQLYTSIFDNSSIGNIARYIAGEHDVEGTIKHAQFTLGSTLFRAMDSSMPHTFEFNEAISLVVECDTQDEIDYYWDKLTADGGEESMCGWLKDKYGVSWQIIPSILGELMSEPGRAERVTKAFMQMRKMDLETLKNA